MGDLSANHFGKAWGRVWGRGFWGVFLLEAILKIEIWFKVEEGLRRQPQEYVEIF
ncbi:MAG: hypothetical protein JRC92_02830 [Deltaproteobacteria bacterium]|nr:hypothetical protein [Deltaproteobacteria bacterium]